MTGFRTVFLFSLRERLLNVNRALLAAAFVLVPFLVRAVENTGLAAGTTVMFLALTFGSGLIGADAASGVLQLVLVRPVTRPAYVFARWLAASCLAAGLAAAQTLLIAAAIAVRGHPASWAALGGVLAYQVAAGFGLTAVLLSLSTFIGGLGDLRAWVLALFGASVMRWGGEIRGWPWLARMGHELGGVVMPTFPAESYGGLEPTVWLSAVTWCSTVTLALALAILIFNRREQSYGSS